MKFNNRQQAAYLLIDRLHSYYGKNPLVLAIPRGAVPMSRILAESLDGDLDVVLAHKVTAPDFPEYAVGSVTETGDIFWGPGATELGLSKGDLQTLASEEIRRLQMRRLSYSPLRPAADPEGRICIVVDDGIATGATMIAAVRSLRERDAEKIIVASPVASTGAVKKLQLEADNVVVLHIPEYFFSVGLFYEEFGQIDDEEVFRILETFNYPHRGASYDPRSDRRYHS